MPRKDPVTGCSVMTLPEFLNEEGAREGKTGGEVLDDIFSAFDADSRRVEQSWRDPEVSFSLIQKCHADDLADWQSEREWMDGLRGTDDEWKKNVVAEYDADPRNKTAPVRPLEVLEVLQAHHHQNFNSSDGYITARVRYEDGRVRHVQWSFTHYNGSRLEPPDGEETAQIIAEEI